jgi:signal transduction histidine kinase/DNA-binding response OmpR family regulator
MAKRNWHVLWLCELDGHSEIFDRELFTRYRDVSLEQLTPSGEGGSEFAERVELRVSEESFDLAVVGADEATDDILQLLRDASPALPVILVVEPTKADRAVSAFRFGVDGYVLRTEEDNLFRDLLAQQIYQHLARDLDPPSTARPRASELLRYAHYYNVLHPFLVFDANERLRFVNQAAREFIREAVGTDGELVVGDRVESLPLEIIDPELVRHIERGLGGEETVTEQHFDMSDGDSGLREVFYSPVYGEAGRVVAVSVGVYLPMHPELREARRHAALGRLAASVAHDFNNLLSIIATSAAMGRRALDSESADLDSRLREQFDVIDRSVRKGEQLTSSLLAYTGRKPADQGAVSLAEFLEGNREFAHNLVGEDVQISLDIDEDVPNIEADRNELEQILLNLLGNARDAMPQGGRVDVSVRAVQFAPEQEPPSPEMRPGEYVEWAVSDSGEGMTAEQLDLAFQPYFTTRDGPRTGLGLATVKGLVRKSRGYVNIASEVGCGTTVTMYWPLSESVSNSEDAETGSAIDTHDPRVLIVEDEEGLRVSLEQLLQPCGCESFAVESAEDALEIFEQLGDIDLLISDIVLPGLDGVELAERLRQQNPNLEVVLMSGYPDQRIGDPDSLSSDGKRFVEKPFDPNEFYDLVEQLVSGKDPGPTRVR